MIIASFRGISKRWQALAMSLSLLAFVAGAVLPAPTASAAATYSCGTYSSGSYSSNSACGASTGGGGTTTDPGVGTPNTGFAKLMEPTNLVAILASLALLVAGIAVILKSRSRKKQDVSFTSRD